MRVFEWLYKQNLIYLSEACPKLLLSLMNEIRVQMEK